MKVINEYLRKRSLDGKMQPNFSNRDNVKIATAFMMQLYVEQQEMRNLLPVSRYSTDPK